jgi:ubiquinone/menaquinone biosynthesis C-methylase UbiE
MIIGWLNSIKNLYAVNPIFFAILYFGTFIPCWYFVFKIIDSIRKKDFDKTILFSIIELFLLALPYLYVLIWGRNFPYWVYIVLSLLMIVSVISSFRVIIKKIRKENKSQLLWNMCSWAYKNAVGHSISHNKMFEDVLKSLNSNKPLLILDAGCGAGDFEKYVCSQNTIISIEAIDFSSQMISGAKKKCVNRDIKFRQVDLDQSLPYPDNYFDGIVCTQVLFALPRIKFTLKEFKRILKKGGILVIAEPRPDANMGRTIIANFKELKNIKGFQKIMAFLDLMVRFPLGLIVLLFNLIIDYWQKQNFYHFYSLKELEYHLQNSKMEPIKTQRTLADQDNLVVAKKIF